jgi:nucleoside-diphosphate-sugar epimerase
MRVLVTGSEGYVGSCLLPELQRRGHLVVGVDAGLLAGCGTGEESPRADVEVRADIRDLEPAAVAQVEAVVHLAGISNDPHGDLDPAVTAEINAAATARLARLCQQQGVSRFVLASSCSVYGAAGDGWLDETSPTGPVTAYARSKLDAERAVLAMGDVTFAPTALRCATAFGPSPRLRGDLVLNNLVGHAVATGRVLLKSTGASWRPVVHVRDIAAACAEILEAPAAAINREVFNVGSTAANYRVRELAELVADLHPTASLSVRNDASADARSYRVNCDKLAARVPGATPRVGVIDGVVELIEHLERLDLDEATLEGPRYQRLAHVRSRQAEGRIDRDLRLQSAR